MLQGLMAKQGAGGGGSNSLGSTIGGLAAGGGGFGDGGPWGGNFGAGMNSFGGGGGGSWGSGMMGHMRGRLNPEIQNIYNQGQSQQSQMQGNSLQNNPAFANMGNYFSQNARFM